VIYLRLEICSLLILKRLGRILIPDLRLAAAAAEEIRGAVAPADFVPHQEIAKRTQRAATAATKDAFCND
jgi:hypothetical protein